MQTHTLTASTVRFAEKRLGLNPKTWKYEFVTEEGHIYPSKSMSPGTICKNGLQYGVCNWIRDPRSKYGLCFSCSFNRYIPNLETQENISRWKILELAKRRLFFNLFRLNIRWSSRWVSPKKGFCSTFRRQPNFTKYPPGKVCIDRL